MISDCDDDYSDDSDDHSYEIDDNSSEHMSDSLSLDLEDEDDIINLNKTVDDQFLNKLCIINTIDNVEFNVDEDDDNVGDHIIQKGVQYPIHDPNIPWKLIKRRLGERYENPSQLKQCLTNYAVANGYQLQYVKNDSERLLVACGKGKKDHTCPFRLWASWMQEEKSFQIKSINCKHIYSRDYSFGSLVTPIWIAKHYVREIIERPFIKIKDMQDDILKKFMVKVSKGQCMRAKSRALLEIEGSLIEHYGKLWDYGHEIRRANPGSIVKMDVNLMADGSNEFRRFYVCFKALTDGWISGCRKVIELDGCFLKGVCKGELISAIGRDGNNQIYPIAWAVVDVENKENWKWFIELLIEYIGVIEGVGLTIMSDQHKGIVEAVKELAPYAKHRQYARHIYANFHKRFNGVEYRNIFWAATTSTFEADFMSYMEKFRIQNIDAYNHLNERDPNTWCRAFFQPDRACEAVENGICESFNSIIVDARRKPIITMLEEIRIFVMERHYKMLSKAQEWESVVCPAIRKKLTKWGENHRYWYVILSGENVFETRNGFEAMVVDLDCNSRDAAYHSSIDCSPSSISSPSSPTAYIAPPSIAHRRRSSSPSVVVAHRLRRPPSPSPSPITQQTSSGVPQPAWPEGILPYSISREVVVNDEDHDEDDTTVGDEEHHESDDVVRHQEGLQESQMTIFPPEFNNANEE
ncbi:uncharacterized protein LOC112506385 [Cynara cardunculus var. scolymus]|uniref:uncharacterized protein LOC112506385 n=1 Tax=Cynara cardunculus var. scolymus TaxID=59895 RepID=UPI000D629F2D|nr:uncharacterized protein LOC112506385 [Cynara cardunculus var. scolymus]